MAKAFNIPTKHRQLKNIAIDLADVLLEDMSRTEPDTFKTIEACANEERKKVWKELDIIPISAYHEVFESYHKTGVGTDGDWESTMKQFLRCGLAFTFSGVVATSIATDCLLGVGDRVTSKVNVGALKKGYVNIAVHGHLPMLVREIVKTGQSKKYLELAKSKGAKGISFYGICCSGLSAMYRYDGVIPLSNAVGAELVLGTGALDLWVADVQDVYPAIMDVVNKGLDVFYYVEKEMPEQLLEAGRRAVKGFGIKSRFIHLEFFKLQNNKKGLGKKGDYIGLESNMRPAGGYTPDMYNYANNTDVYQIWADMIAFDKIEKAELNENIEKNYCVYASRRDNKNYVHSHDEIKQKYGNAIVMDERMPDIFSEAMGNYMYTAKFATKEEMDEFINFVHEKTEE